MTVVAAHNNLADAWLHPEKAGVPALNLSPVFRNGNHDPLSGN